MTFAETNYHLHLLSAEHIQVVMHDVCCGAQLQLSIKSVPASGTEQYLDSKTH